MKLATLKDSTRDGSLIVVSRDGTKGVSAHPVARHLQFAIDRWADVKEPLEKIYRDLNSGTIANTFAVDQEKLHSPLPRAYAWCDGSSYLNHVRLVRKARGAEPPPTLESDPLMYQGGSDAFLPPRGDILVADENYGIDLEGEVAIITDDVPMGCSAKTAGNHIILVMLCNDVSLRNLIPDELAKGFGFFQGKPSSAFSPFAITPDELGSSWKDNRLHLPLESWINGKFFGNPDAGPEMHFSFSDLIAHAAKTRPLSAGTIIGSGTVSNTDQSRGSSCLAEKRTIEKIESGKAVTPFLKFGDTVTIEMKKDNVSLFGRIHQTVKKYQGPK